jgi:hypothetical protein
MRGTELSQEQIEAARHFLDKAGSGNLPRPGPGDEMAMSYRSLITLVAFYGAVCYEEQVQAAEITMELTAAQLDSAKGFLDGVCRLPEVPKIEQNVRMSYDNIVRAMAWYGAIRQEAAAQGVGTVGQPGIIIHTKKNPALV